jgi:hypothetical protein
MCCDERFKSGPRDRSELKCGDHLFDNGAVLIHNGRTAGGLQLIGSVGSEELLLRVALCRTEAATPRPTVAYFP